MTSDLSSCMNRKHEMLAKRTYVKIFFKFIRLENTDLCVFELIDFT